MCGRAAFRVDRSHVQRRFVRIRGSTEREEEDVPEATTREDGLGSQMRVNGAPGTTCAFVIAYRHGEMELRKMVFGLIPSTFRANTDAGGGWPRAGDFFRLFNARSEEIAPTYRRLVQRGQRCVVFVRGFFEWRSEAMGKQPYFIQRKATDTDTDGAGAEESVLMLAGLWDEWTGRGTDADDGSVMKMKKMRRIHEEKMLRSFTIFTRDADSSWIHHRIPVILRDEEEAKAFLCYGRQPKSSGQNSLTFHAVDAKINAAQYEGDDCIEQTRRAALKDTSSIASFFTRADPSAHTHVQNEEKVPEKTSTADFVKKKEEGKDEKKLVASMGLVHDDTSMGKDGTTLNTKLKRSFDDDIDTAPRSYTLLSPKKKRRTSGDAASPASAATSPSGRRTHHQAGIKEFFAPSPARQSN